MESNVAACERAVVVGGAWLGGVFCAATGVVVSFFGTPLVGIAAGVSCAASGGVAGYDATLQCRVAGETQKETECPSD